MQICQWTDFRLDGELQTQGGEEKTIVMNTPWYQLIGQTAICKTSVFILLLLNAQGLRSQELGGRGELFSSNKADGRGQKAEAIYPNADRTNHQATDKEQGFDAGNSNSASLRQVPQLNASSPESICPAQLGAAIDAMLTRPQLRRTRWGILIEPLLPDATDRALYRRESERYFIPASNVKLLTTAAALHQLGSQFRIRTSVYAAGAGSLRVVGRGDPSLTDAQLSELARQLKRQGVRTVQQLIIDPGYFQGEAINPTWEWEDLQADYATSVTSLILNQNAVELTVSPQQPGQPLQVSWSDPIAGRQWRIENESATTAAGTSASVTIAGVLGQPVLRIQGQLPTNSEPESFSLAILDPAKYFLQRFQRALVAEGINVIGGVVESNQGSAGEQELAAVESPPLSTLLVETNQESNNLYAEILLRTLEASIKRADSENSDDIGLDEMKAALTELGVDPENYVLADGSGLSRHNLVSPDAIAQTLQLMAQSPEALIYRASLPVAGLSGTLENRFRNTLAQGNLRAKTGTLSGISALSGYLDIPGYQTLVFSIIVNQSDQSAATLRQAIDEIVLLLTRLHSCQSR